MRSATANWHKLYPGIAALLLLLSGCGGAQKTVLEDVVEHVYTVEPDARITIQNRDGAVLVYGSTANEIRVRAAKKAYSRERLSQIAIDVSKRPGAISISTKFPPQPKWSLSDRSGTVEYTIVVPAGATIAALDLSTGEILLDSLGGGEVNARLDDGRLFVRNCFTDLNLTMHLGTLGLSYDWWEAEHFSAHMKLTQGNAWFWLPSDAAFHLIANVARGKIANDFNNLPVMASSAARGMNVDQIINGGGSARVQIGVEKGNIRIGEANP